MANVNWRDPAYLSRGNAQQQKGYRILKALDIFEVLHPYTPVLAGTIPLDMDINGSDLDVICEAHDLDAFARVVIAAYGSQTGFGLSHRIVEGVPRVVADFSSEGMPVQIFGQPHPVVEQNAYRHMIVEARLLEIGGDKAREEIRRLKLAGLRTEPAFARYFNLNGDPYAVLLELANLEPEELRRAIGQNSE